jgi:hypothetical protein
MVVARAWELSPDEWYRRPRWSRAAMVAQYDVEMAIQWWTAEDNAR